MRRAGYLVLLVLSVALAAYAVAMYSIGPGSERLHPAIHANFLRHPLGIATHVFAAALALLLGPLQFSTRARRRWPALHRWTGRVYLGVAVLVGGIAGLYMSAFAFGGTPARLGFAALALAWLATGGIAYRAARARDWAAHRRWMVRNFALAFAAVTLRLYLPPAIVFGLPFETAYAAIAWLCWVPNLLLAEWLLLADRPRVALGGVAPG